MNDEKNNKMNWFEGDFKKASDDKNQKGQDEAKKLLNFTDEKDQ
jgi:hypothetical protein